MRWIWGRSRTDILAGLTVSATGLFVLTMLALPALRQGRAGRPARESFRE